MDIMGDVIEVDIRKMQIKKIRNMISIAVREIRRKQSEKLDRRESTYSLRNWNLYTFFDLSFLT